MSRDANPFWPTYQILIVNLNSFPLCTNGLDKVNCHIYLNIEFDTVIYQSTGCDTDIFLERHFSFPFWTRSVESWHLLC